MDKIEAMLGGKSLEGENVSLNQNDHTSLNKGNYKILNHASPKRRYLGQFLDMLITWGIFIICLYSLNKFSVPEDIAGVISVTLAFIYLILSDGLPKGQSLGKKILSISVVSKETGEYCTFWQSFLRNILTPILGAIDAIFILSKKRQRVGDMIADTVVIKNS